MARTSRPSRAQQSRLARVLLAMPRKAAASLPFLVLAIAVIGVLAVIGLATTHPGSHVGSGTGNGTKGQPTAPVPAQATKTCGFPGLPACAAPQPDWIPIASTSPADILAAARKSPLLATASSGQGDTVALSRLGAPLLVQAYLASTTNTLPDYFVIPALDTSNATIGAVLCMLNSQHTAIYVGDIVGYPQSRPAGLITKLSAQDAISAVASQAHVSPRAGSGARLVYFPFNQNAEDTGQIHWTAGGNTPYDPMWLIPGADGQDHLVGSDGHVYAPGDLPVKPA